MTGLDLCYGRWDDHTHRLFDFGSAKPNFVSKTVSLYIYFAVSWIEVYSFLSITYSQAKQIEGQWSTRQLINDQCWSLQISWLVSVWCRILVVDGLSFELGISVMFVIYCANFLSWYIWNLDVLSFAIYIFSKKMLDSSTILSLVSLSSNITHFCNTSLRVPVQFLGTEKLYFFSVQIREKKTLIRWLIKSLSERAGKNILELINHQHLTV